MEKFVRQEGLVAPLDRANVDTDAIIESFTRHLMTAFDQWRERGFEAIARDYLERLPKHKAGERRGIDVLDRVWDGPDSLPSTSELEHPADWVARVGPAPAAAA